MKLTSDPSGRFDRRPHYEPYELDDLCEQLIEGFLQERYRRVEYPISTEDLTLLIERDIDDYDSAADLSDLGEDVEGVTDFFLKKKPRVRIAAHLWDHPSRENRLRTTLTHEFGHVRLHNYLYQMEGSLRLYESITAGLPQRCKRDDVRESTYPSADAAVTIRRKLLLLSPIQTDREVGFRPVKHQPSFRQCLGLRSEGPVFA